MSDAKESLWSCPDCGHRFVTPNMWHSCSNYTLEHHFAGKDPVVRAIFDRMVEVLEQCGPVTVIPQKTRIALQVLVRFAGGAARKKWFNAALWLTRVPDHPLIARVERYGDESYGIYFKLQSPDDIDDRMIELLHEAYRVGCREHLEKSAEQ